MPARRITARFYVAEVTRRANGAMRNYAEPVPLGEVVMRPAYKSPANEAWASATPSGEFKMTVRGEALPFFEESLGRDLHITLELAPHEFEDGCTGEHSPARESCEMAPA